MQKLLFVLTFIFGLTSCSSDKFLEFRFAGSYDVTVDSPKTDKELKKAKKEMERDISKAQKDVSKSVEEAKDNIERDLGKDSPIGNALKSLVEGVGKMAEGMTELGEGLGELGIELGQGVLKGLKFKVEFKKNGEVVFGNGRSSDVKYWNIENGLLYIWEYEDEKMVFEMKPKSGSEWELKGEKVTFHLTERKK